MASMPRLPARKPPLSTQGNTKPAAEGPGSGLHAAMLSQLKNIANNPVMKRLIENPELLNVAKERDPMLKRLLDSAPGMSSYLAPEKLKALMDMAKDPAVLKAGSEEMFGGMDLTEQRKAVIQLEAYTRELQNQVVRGSLPGASVLSPGAQPGPQAGQAGGSGGGGADPSAVFQKMQSRLQQLQRMQIMASTEDPAERGGGPGPSQAGWPAGMRPPNQSPAFFKPPSTQPGGSDGGPDYQGGFSFTHTEREVPLHELPYEVQQQVLAQYGGSSTAAAAAGGAASPLDPGTAFSSSSAAAAASLLGDGPSSSAASGPGQPVLSFAQWQQQLAAAAARASITTPPSAWPAAGGPPAAAGGGGHGSPLLPTSTMAAEHGRAAGSSAAGSSAGAGCQSCDHGLGHGHNHGHGHHGHSHGHGHGHSHGLAPWLGFGGHQAGGPGAAGGGAACCADHGHTGGGRGTAEGSALKVRPRDYYEPVEPNLTWRPSHVEENCGSLYRRAYSSYCDMVFFPPFFLLAGILVTAAPSVPFWLLACGLVVGALGGSHCFMTVLGGISREKLPASRNFLSLIATCEIVYPAVYGYHVLPYWSGCVSLTTLVLLAGFVLMPVLHLWAATADPGYVPSKKHQQVPGSGAAVKPAAAVAAAAAAEERLPLLSGDSGSGAAAAGGASAAQGADVEAARAGQNARGEDDEDNGEVRLTVQCTTCLVPRPLRSKHCQFCNRCVRRFDHHCPAIGNCVGEANERCFAAWLFVMVVTQVLVVYVALSFMLQRHLVESGAAASSSAPDTGPLALWRAVQWAAGGPERGLLLLAALQAFCLVPGILLAARQAFCVAANLTANELINRGRYKYLQDELGDYRNRFDRGVVRNCFSFWLERDPDWWSQYDRGDRELTRRRVRQLSFWSVSWLVHWLDDYKTRHKRMAEKVKEIRMEKARRGLEVRAQAAAAAQAAAGVVSRSGAAR